jgi:exopolysaccharide production protein ExoQ
MILPRRSIQFAHLAYVIFILILSTDAFLPLLVRGNDPQDVTQGSPAMQASWGIIYCISLASLFKRRDHGVTLVLSKIRTNKPLAFLVLLTFASTTWSIDTWATFHGAVILTLSALMAIDLATRYNVVRQIQLVCIALALCVFISAFLELALPGLIPSAGFEGNAWHGVFTNKNQLGRMSTLGVAAYLAWPRQPRWRKVAAVLCGIVIGILAQSASSVGYLVIICVAVIASAALKWKPRPRKVAIVAGTAIALVAVSTAMLNPVRTMTLIGKDPTMTGRVGLWKLSLGAVEQQPLKGYGYRAFWSSKSAVARPIRQELNWDAPHSHDGYIEVALALGLVGLMTYILVIAGICRRGVVLFMGGSGNYRTWPLVYLLFMSIYQVTESTMITGNTIFWILLVWLACVLPPAQSKSPASRRYANHAWRSSTVAALHQREF